MKNAFHCSSGGEIMVLVKMQYSSTIMTTDKMVHFICRVSDKRENKDNDKSFTNGTHFYFIVMLRADTAKMTAIKW